MKRVVEKNIFGKRAQQTMGLPFGMIFSLLLIVVFIVIAFIGIKHFLDIGSTADVGLFYEDLQDAVDKAWTSQAGEFAFDLNLPSAITTICFANLSQGLRGPNNQEFLAIRDYEYYDANVFLLPTGEAEGMEFREIRHLNMEKIVQEQNPYCVDTDSTLTIKKDFYDKLVSVV